MLVEVKENEQAAAAAVASGVPTASGGDGGAPSPIGTRSADAHLLRCFGYFVRSSSVAFLDDLWEEIADGFIPCAI
eukprot:3329442-Pyramimonas_sp.AAC.1